MNHYQIFGILSAIIWTISAWPYIYSTIKGKTRPNAYSFLFFVILTGTAFFAQYSEEGFSWSLLVLGIGLFNCMISLVLSLSGYGYKKFYKSDYVFYSLAFFTLIIWYFTKDNLLAFLLSLTVDFLATIPLFKKTWYEPESEDALAWGLASFAALLAIFSVSDIKIITIFYPIYAFITNGIICLFGLNLYRKYFKQ